MFKKFSFLIALLFCSNLYASTVSFDQLATSSDLTTTKYNRDLDTIYQKVNSSIQTDNIEDDTLTEADMADEINPRIRTYEGAACELVYSGFLSSTTSGTLVGSVPGGTAYPRGFRIVKSSTPKTFTASRWTYVDLDQNGNFTYQEVTIGSAAPSVAVNSIRLERVSTDGTQIVDVQDLRTTSCAQGSFSVITSATGEPNLDDVLRNGTPVRRFSPAGRTPQGFAQGAFVSFANNTTFTVTPGTLFINGEYRSISTDLTVPNSADDPANGVSGIDTGVIAANTTYFVYAVADLGGVKPFSASFSTSSSAPTGVTNARLIGQIKTDNGGSFVSKDYLTVHGMGNFENVGGWVNFDGTPTPLVSADAFNVSSLTHSGTGAYTVTWDRDFNKANYAVVCGGSASDGNLNNCQVEAPAVGSVALETINQGDANEDQDVVTVIAFGDTRN